MKKMILSCLILSGLLLSSPSSFALSATGKFMRKAINKCSLEMMKDFIEATKGYLDSYIKLEDGDSMEFHIAKYFIYEDSKKDRAAYYVNLPIIGHYKKTKAIKDLEIVIQEIKGESDSKEKDRLFFKYFDDNFSLMLQKDFPSISYSKKTPGIDFEGMKDEDFSLYEDVDFPADSADEIELVNSVTEVKLKAKLDSKKYKECVLQILQEKESRIERELYNN